MPEEVRPIVPQRNFCYIGHSKPPAGRSERKPEERRNHHYRRSPDMQLISDLTRSFRFYYYSYKNGWHFPDSMVHTSGSRIAAGTYEPDVSGVIAGLLGEGDTFIDAGANVGYFSRLAGEIVGEKGRVYAFEMEPTNYDALARNTGHLRSVVPVCMGLSEESRIMEFNRSSHSTCHSIMETDNYLDGTTFRNLVVPLDWFWEQFLDRREITLVKADVEGAEMHLLRGMEKMLEAGAVRNLVIEYCPALLANSRVDTGSFYSLLSRHFSLEIIEEEYHFSEGDGRIESAARFEELTGRLLDRPEAVNINVLCSSA